MDEEIIWWPDEAHAIDGELGIVTVNYNTAHLISLLIWSIHRFVPPARFQLVVVDNGSTDGSSEILRAVSEAGLCRLVGKPANRYHGPALNQGVSELARRHRAGTSIRWVWLLDSDSVVARSDTWSKLKAAATMTGVWHDRRATGGEVAQARYPAPRVAAREPSGRLEAWSPAASTRR